MSTNAVASSSKRSAPSTSSTPAKRPRSSKAESVVDDMSDVEQEGDCDGNMDDATRAKALRKEARTIRNRESAQRSRNQRKAHLVFLEQRVNELEAENRALRAGETPPPRASTSSSAEREASPAQSVISLANDLGIPPEIVSSSGGVSLANVAPPPADLETDVKPIIAPPSPVPVPQPTAFGEVTLTHLQSENASLKERIGLLENLVKQVVALANLSGLPTTTPTPVPPPQTVRSASTVSEHQSLDWDALVNPPQNNSLDATLSPPMYPVQPLEPAQPTFDLTPSLPSAPAFPSINTEMNLACHPAAGEEQFNFGTYGHELEAFGNDGKGGGRNGAIAGNVVPFPFDLEQGGNVTAIGSTNNAQAYDRVEMQAETVEVEAEWDEGMRALLEDLEGRGLSGEVKEKEVVQGQIKKEFNGMEEWWYGRNDGMTALGLAM